MFIPKNGYVVVERVEQKTETEGSSFVVPEHLRMPAKAVGTEIVKICQSIMLDSEHLLKDTLIAVESTTLEEFVYDNKVYLITKVSFIKGYFDNEEK